MILTKSNRKPGATRSQEHGDPNEAPAQHEAELSADGKHPIAILEELPEAVVPERRRTAGLYHFAILVPDRKSLGLSVGHLIRHGVDFGQGDHWVSEAIYLSDPDNNGIEIYADRPRSEWEYDPQGGVKMGTDPVDVRGLLELAGGEPWNGLPAGTKIGHIHLHVSDLPSSRQFYCDVLGFGLMANFANSALFVSAGGYHHHIGLNIWAGVGAPPAPPQAPGLKYYEVLVPELAELKAIGSRLAEAGIPFERKDEAIEVQDPSGNTLIIRT
ncbi:VOC family protein [Cohnella thermotolerans]|uniref:VOC family protein n=1 Tax=Cohnella thermotolerans TaxID=329858 RepID=UPI0009FD00B3|nr:VOC family protein [Cohnella thermotolerans]